MILISRVLHQYPSKTTVPVINIMRQQAVLSLSLSFLLVLILCPAPGETAVYYVTPTESPTVSLQNECPGEPCHTLDYYFCVHRDVYFNSTQVNVTMILLQGKHNYTNCGNCDKYTLKDMEVFEMIGNGSAVEVVVYLTTKLQLVNVTRLYFGNLTFMNAKLPHCERYDDPSIELPDNDDDDINGDQDSPNSGRSKPRDGKVFVTVVNRTIFNNVMIYQAIERLMNFNTTVIDSHFTNQSVLGVVSQVVGLNMYTDYIRQLDVIRCTFSNSSLFIAYIRVNLSIYDSKLSVDGVAIAVVVEHGNVVIAGNTLFSNITYYVPGMSGTISFFSSNITISGNITFANNAQTPITAYSSTVTLSGNISFVNNNGTNGGALALYSSTLNVDSNTTVNFINNTATDTGGAIYVTNDKNRFAYPEYVPCFYQLLDYGADSNWYNIRFENNTARNGGDHIYGESMHSCACYAVPIVSEDDDVNIIPTYCVQKQVFSYHPNSTSSISSDPTRVCLCDHGKPNCYKFKQLNIEIHPGEQFTLSAVIVGADLGTTIGAVYTVLDDQSSSVVLKPTTQVISSTTVCTELNYTIYSEGDYQALYLTVKPESLVTVKRFLEQFIPGGGDDQCSSTYYGCDSDYITYELLHTPLLVNVTLLACPRGFTLLGNPPSCRCYPVLTKNNVVCFFKDNIGYQTWNSSIWIDIDADLTVYMAQYCPFGYCITSQKIVSFDEDSSAQCLSDRKGTLCGGCKKNFSLAIGSSNCIHCPNNNNLALIIFFAAAGLLLVLFISALNLTVTQGMINRLTFYANIFWTYQNILIPHDTSNYFFAFLRVVVAWLNLDFGIEACFFKGLNAFWKTWLQYLFPLYIWSISGLMIIGAKYSSKLTKLFGDRAVSVLATLFLLSYIKLLKIIIDSLGFTPIKIFNTTSYSHTLTVWSLDGSYTYGHFPHILLVIAALAVFTIVWLPFTLALFLMPWLRRISDFKLLKWIPRLNPVFDAYFAPLKNKHHYYFGVLLIVRGVLLVVFTATYAIFPKINYFLVMLISAMLLCYANYHRVYKNKAVQFTDNLFLLLLVIIGGSGYLEEQARHTVAYVSIAIGIIGLLGISVGGKLFQICFQKRKLKRENFAPQIQNERQPKVSHDANAQFRDSIFDETEPLINATQTIATY